MRTTIRVSLASIGSLFFFCSLCLAQTSPADSDTSTNFDPTQITIQTALVLVLIDITKEPVASGTVTTGTLDLIAPDQSARRFSVSAFGLRDFFERIGFGECFGGSRDCSRGIPGGMTFEELSPLQQAAYLHDVRLAERLLRTGKEWYQPDRSKWPLTDGEFLLIHCQLLCGLDYYVASLAALGEYAKDFLDRFGDDGAEEEDVAAADPTFIQPSPNASYFSSVGDLLNSLPSLGAGVTAELSVPYPNALVRGEVPIFGVAYGEEFKSYRVEYGKGLDPVEWTEISSSDEPQKKDVTPEDLDDSADLTIHGNLGTWDTGLKTYAYLPSHPKDHPINLKGIYTVRVVATAQDGTESEDRVAVHVANTIPNAWGGTAVSDDGLIQLEVPEQSLTEPFRLIGFEPMSPDSSSIAGDRQFVGSAYLVREAGEQFTKPAKLSMRLPDRNADQAELDRLAIYGFDPEKSAWIHLPSERTADNNALVANVDRLHERYAILSSNLRTEGSKQTTDLEQSLAVNRMLDSEEHYLVFNDFEDDKGQWSGRDGEFGASLELVSDESFEGSRALKLTNAEEGGSFAATVLDKPFDARKFPVVQFDYRIGSGIKSNFLFKVDGRWYEVTFTDDPKDLEHRRLNIASIGQVEGVVADGEWHTARFNLYNMLLTKTRNYVVEEIVMADWDATGLMKLSFGSNAEGAEYWIDNFSISRDGTTGFQLDDNVVMLDDFNRRKITNAFGQDTAIFNDAFGGTIDIDFTEDSESGSALKLSYDLEVPGQYAGYVSPTPKFDLRHHRAIGLSLKGTNGSANAQIGVRDAHGNESKLSLGMFAENLSIEEWSDVEIPLVAFADTIDWSGILNISISFENPGATSGELIVDDLRFESVLPSLVVDRFESQDNFNLISGRHQTFTEGAATVSGARVSDAINQQNFYRISYGGAIGELNAYASGTFTYAGWRSDLKGLDCSKCDALRFRIRGAESGEQPNIYLDDGNHRWGVDLQDYVEVTTEWQDVEIPMEHFAEYGVDLTSLTGMEIVFEWEKMSGTIYVDDIEFGWLSKERASNGSLHAEL